MAAYKFFYFGDDEAYFKTLNHEFSRASKIALTFQRFFEKDEKKIQSFLVKTFKDGPSVVFIDFSKQAPDYLHLARLISRTPLDFKILTVGLVDYLSPPQVLAESIATGVQLTHVKGPEAFDVVFDVLKIIAPAEIATHGYATATVSEEVEAGVPAKVGYIHKDGLHLETDYPVEKGSKIILEHFWLGHKLVPSKQAFVSEVSQKNMFYHFKRNCDVDFVFLDEFIPPENFSPEEIKAKEAERLELIEYQRKQLKKWVGDNVQTGVGKSAKVLVVDQDFKFFQDQIRTDKHPYIFRCIPYFQEMAEEIERLQPQIIAFCLDPLDKKNPRNDNETLIKLAECLKTKFKDLDPFVVVFNSKTPSKDLQASLKYDHVMAIESELDVELMIKMTSMIEKKLENKMTAGPTKEMVFISKSQPSSLCEIQFSIKIVKISETDMIIQTQAPIHAGMNLHLKKPVDMYVHLLPMKTQGKIPEFYGLIHSINENEKKELRRHVNTIFFKDHDAKVSSEIEEFKKLNEAKLNEKIEKEKTEGDADSGEEGQESKPKEPAE